MTSETDVFTPKDQRFFIPSSSGELELMGRKGDEVGEDRSDWLVVVCHPHPQHGGSMDNKVVATVARAARQMGLDSLRFNYRGVGNSTGHYGEFEGECEDLDTVIDWVRTHTSKSRFMLAGFSFGSAVVAVRVNHIAEAAQAVIIAPPTERYDYPTQFRMPVSIIQGADDEVVDADSVTDWVKTIGTEYDYYFSGQTSHFFHGKLVELRHKLVAIMSSVLG